MIAVDRHAALHYLNTETGKRYPSVSQVLDVLYGDRFCHVAPDVLTAAKARGTRLHLLFGCLLLWQAGVADKPEIEAGDELVANGLVNWIVDHHVSPLKVEEPAINDREGYAGTPDAMVLYGTKRVVTLLDLKTGAKDAAHGLQLQMYARLHGYRDATVLMALYCDDEGNVKEDIIKPSPHDVAWFAAGVQVLKGRQARGMK